MKYSTAADTMTELQLRLWCLWMCDAFASLTPIDSFRAATKAAHDSTKRKILGFDQLAIAEVGRGNAARISLRAWQLSERNA